MNDEICLQKEIETMNAAELEACLHSELKRENPNAERVRGIMSALRRLDAKGPKEIPPEVREQWLKMQERSEPEEEPRKGTKTSALQMVGKIAAVAATLAVVLFGVPCAFGARNIVELVVMWADDTFHFSMSDETINTTSEYVFFTEHVGLHEIYNTVTSLGVNVPVVPMWVPEGVHLEEVKVSETEENTTVWTSLKNEDLQIVFICYIDKSGDEHQPRYVEDNHVIEKKEIGEVVHNLSSNAGDWIAVWVNGNAECFVSVNGDKELLVEILRSIYQER